MEDVVEVVVLVTLAEGLEVDGDDTVGQMRRNDQAAEVRARAHENVELIRGSLDDIYMAVAKMEGAYNGVHKRAKKLLDEVQRLNLAGACMCCIASDGIAVFVLARHQIATAIARMHASSQQSPHLHVCCALPPASHFQRIVEISSEPFPCR